MGLDFIYSIQLFFLLACNLFKPFLHPLFQFVLLFFYISYHRFTTLVLSIFILNLTPSVSVNWRMTVIVVCKNISPSSFVGVSQPTQLILPYYSRYVYLPAVLIQCCLLFNRPLHYLFFLPASFFSIHSCPTSFRPIFKASLLLLVSS